MNTDSRTCAFVLLVAWGVAYFYNRTLTAGEAALCVSVIVSAVVLADALRSGRL